MIEIGPDRRAILRRIRLWLGVMIVGLVLSGVTAFPLDHETRWLVGVLRDPSLPFLRHAPGLVTWLSRVRQGVADTDARYPFLAYGTDWLAFAHVMIAILFWGPYRDPVRNVWVIRWGMLACAGIVPLALICGPIRGIPWWWSLIDMSFGVFGVLPLIFAERWARRLAALDVRASEPFVSGTQVSGGSPAGAAVPLEAAAGSAGSGQP